MQCIIPAIISIALLVGCGNNDSDVAPSITVAQRRAAIDSAYAHLDGGRIAEALAITSKLVAKDPSSAQSQESHALVLLAEAGRLDAMGERIKANEKRVLALNAYEAACASSTNPGLLQLSTAQLAQMIAEDEIAIGYYKRAHDNVPNDGRPAFFISQMFMLQKEWVEAKFWIEQSIQRNPNEPFTLLSYALVEAELGNMVQAKQLAARGCEMKPNDPNLRFFQARIMRLAGDPAHAIEILAALPQALQDSPVGLEEHAKCMSLLKEDAP